MSREIKFRAWHERHKQMIYREIFDRNWYTTNNKVYAPIHPDDKYDYKLMQFTGLKDKNGKDIYESDLCLINEVIYCIEYIQDFMTFCPFRQHEWEWFKEGNNHFKYCYESSHLIEGTIHFLSQLESYEIEVIGNIHENLELLQGEGDE